MGRPPPEGEPPSMAAARAARLAAALARCVDVSAGTLWRVREDAWVQRLEKGYRSTRSWHPGLSLRQGRPPASLYEQVPMLHGSSGSGHGFVVRGVTRQLGPAHATHFGHFAPVSFAVVDLVGVAALASEAPPLAGFGLDRYAVTVNHDKPRVTADEYRCMESWARQRRFWS
ncbi:MAG: hypothetical protein GX595_12055 [Lentisphaerae bacterium]|nr:hypothetical protein [Lentisphaerota bacterium]